MAGAPDRLDEVLRDLRECRLRRLSYPESTKGRRAHLQSRSRGHSPVALPGTVRIRNGFGFLVIFIYIYTYI